MTRGGKAYCFHLHLYKSFQFISFSIHSFDVTCDYQKAITYFVARVQNQISLIMIKVVASHKQREL